MRTVESKGKIFGRSLINTEKRVGPRMEPWGIQEEGNPGVQYESATQVNWE